MISKWLLSMFCIFMVTVTKAQVRKDEPYLIMNSRSGKYGFAINKRKLIPTIYDSVDVFREGLAAVKTETGWGYIDTHGKVVIPLNLSVAKCFEDSLAIVAKADRWGVLKSNGQWSIPPQYEHIYPKRGGVFEAKSDKKWGLLYPGGSLACGFRFEQIGWYSGGMWSVRDSAQKWGFLDESHRLAIPCTFYQVGLFVDGFAPARKIDGKFGYIGLNGNWKIQPAFSLGLDFQDGYAIVLTGAFGEKYRLIDTLGRFALPGEFDHLDASANGYYLAALKGKYSFWNPRDSMPFAFGLDGAWTFHRGYAFVCIGCEKSKGDWQGGEWGLLDTLGNVYHLPQKYQSLFAINGAEFGLENRVMDAQHAKWIERSRKISVKAFSFGK